MGVNVRIDGLMVVAGLVVIAGVALYLNREKIAQVVDSAAATVNPFDPNNIANRSVNAWGGYFTGEPSWTLGGAVYDWTH